jgi:hypothetical protein
MVPHPSDNAPQGTSLEQVQVVPAMDSAAAARRSTSSARGAPSCRLQHARRTQPIPCHGLGGRARDQRPSLRAPHNILGEDAAGPGDSRAWGARSQPPCDGRCDGQEPLHRAISRIRAIDSSTARPASLERELAYMQRFPPTERRRNRTIQAEGCAALPVLKTGVSCTQVWRVTTTAG